jgi:hypothetical protein
METLESRWCPSASITFKGHLLVISADAAADSISVVDDGKGDVAAKLISPSGNLSGNGSGIEAIVINAGAGNDEVSFGLTGPLTTNLAIALHMGKGSDSADFDLGAGIAGAKLAIDADSGLGKNHINARLGSVTDSAVELSVCGPGSNSATLNFAGDITGSTVKASVNGGCGASSVHEKLGNVTRSTVSLVTHFQEGDNTFTASLQGALKASTVSIEADGGAGSDAMSFNASATYIGALSALDVKLVAGTGKDTIASTYSGRLDGALSIQEFGGPGNDTVTENLTINPGSCGHLYARIFGGLGNDTEILNVFDNSGGPGGKSKLADLDAVIFAILGHNTVIHTPNVRVVTQ